MRNQCRECVWLDKMADPNDFWCLNSKTHPIDKDNEYIKPMGVLDFNPRDDCPYFKDKTPWWKFWK